MPDPILPVKTDLWNNTTDGAGIPTDRIVTDCSTAFLRGWVNFNLDFIPGAGTSRTLWRLFLSAEEIEAAGAYFEPYNSPTVLGIHHITTKWTEIRNVVLVPVAWHPILGELGQPTTWVVTAFQSAVYLPSGRAGGTAAGSEGIPAPASLNMHIPVCMIDNGLSLN